MTKAARKQPSSGTPAPESFQPFALESPTNLRRKITWRLRMLADLQAASIAADVQPHLQLSEGATVVDVGCGDMPYKHLAEKNLRYFGFDVAHARSLFGYGKEGVKPFDGQHIPMNDESADLVLCTEVLEHHPAPAPLIQEMHRILKPGAKAVVTVPWSARMHYLPEDYHRYSSRVLHDMFARFRKVEVTPRGTDVSAVCNKLMVIFMRSAGSLRQCSAKGLAGTMMLGWAMPAATFFGQWSLTGRLGSVNDPLGFTVIATK